jgi:hypothetical protein
VRLPRVEDVERLLPRPDDFDDRARGARLSARVGLALGIAFGVCFLTGLWSHAQYASPGWLPIGPDPSWLYRVTQGLHVTTGVAAVPLLLVKLWSVYPLLFRRPPPGRSRALVLDVFERGSIGVLVAAAVFQLASGLANIVQWYPWQFSFRRTHEAVAWVAIGALLVHVAVKLPVIRAALAAPLDGVDDAVVGDAADPDVPSRRAVLSGAIGASALAALLTAGQSVPVLRRVSVFGVRDGEGPQGLPVNRTARAAGATEAASASSFALEVVAGDRLVRLTRADLAALPQRTHRLPIACVEGWSRDATWTGVAVKDLLALVGATGSDVTVRSMQTRGAFAESRLPADFVADPRTLLALELNGEPLSLDHGYPCRVIAPNRPGVLQTKWVRRLEAAT